MAIYNGILSFLIPSILGVIFILVDLLYKNGSKNAKNIVFATGWCASIVYLSTLNVDWQGLYGASITFYYVIFLLASHSLGKLISKRKKH